MTEMACAIGTAEAEADTWCVLRDKRKVTSTKTPAFVGAGNCPYGDKHHKYSTTHGDTETLSSEQK